MTEQKQIVLITGASSGIGKSLAHLFAKDGATLILAARSTEKMEAMKKELHEKYQSTVLVYTCDLSNPKSAKELYQFTKEKNLTVDVLVNNAGFGTLGAFSETPLQEEFDMIQLNITSLTILCKLFVKDMIARNSGKILNVASTAAFQPGPFMAVYFATKSYVLFLSEALAEELRGTNVNVSALCPGPTETGFQQRAFRKTNPSWSYMDVETVAQVAFEGLKKNKTIIIPGFQNKLLSFAIRFTPRKLAVKVLRSIVKK